MMAFGRAAFSVHSTGRDKTKLERFCRTKLRGSGKMTHVMTMCMPHNNENFNTKEQTVWDQHKTYYTSKGMIDREHCDALLEDVVKNLLLWKHEDCKIVLTGDFSDDAYRGKIAE